jgi:hypothetical protein
LAQGIEHDGLELGVVAPGISGGPWIAPGDKAPEMKNKVVLVVFWASRNRPSNVTVPDINALAARYAEDGLVVVAPSVDAPMEVLDFKKRNQVAYPLLCVPAHVVEAYRVKSTPMIFLLGKDRKVVWKGHYKDRNLEPLIERALKAPVPEEPEVSITVYVLKDGQKIRARTAVDGGDEYVIKDEDGKFVTIKKNEVVEIKKQ